jgi:hypothetical protein
VVYAAHEWVAQQVRSVQAVQRFEAYGDAHNLCKVLVKMAWGLRCHRPRITVRPTVSIETLACYNVVVTTTE